MATAAPRICRKVSAQTSPTFASGMRCRANVSRQTKTNGNTPGFHPQFHFQPTASQPNTRGMRKVQAEEVSSPFSPNQSSRAATRIRAISR